MNLELKSFVGKLQTLAHEGYALHKVAVRSKCNKCETNATLIDPAIDIQIDESTKTVILSFEENN